MRRAVAALTTLVSSAAARARRTLPEPVESKRVRRRGEEPDFCPVTTPDGEIAPLSAGSGGVLPDEF
jgi:hypothetical protein